jgi:hypothetical protein
MVDNFESARRIAFGDGQELSRLKGPVSDLIPKDRGILPVAFSISIGARVAPAK